MKGRCLPAALCALLAFCLLACKSLGQAASPVVIFDWQIAEGPLKDGGRGLGVEFEAANLSGRPVQSVLFCASVTESTPSGGQEESAGAAFFEARLLVDYDVGQGARIFIPFEDAGADCGSDDFEIESLCVERAVFEDGEMWP